MKTSRVLEAMQVQPEIASNTIRVSIGWNTSRKEVERFCEVWLDLAGTVTSGRWMLRRMGAGASAN